MAPTLTAGEECKAAAQALSAFTGTGSGGDCIPKNFISMAMAIAIFRGENGVAMVRLKSGDWSAPCAIILEVPHGGSVQPGQDSVLLFMTESSVLALVARTRLILDGTHKFQAGIYSASGRIDPSNDIYAYVRFNNQFTPASLLSSMSGWGVREDMTRHARWHGFDVTWADVLMNKITVDRSSIGNALYLVVNIAAGGNSQGVIEVNGRKNFADLDKLPTRIGLDSEAPRASVAVPLGPTPAQLAEQQLKHQQEAMQQLLIQQQREQQQLYLQQQQILQQQPSPAIMAGGYGGLGALVTPGPLSPTFQAQQITFPQQQQALGGYISPTVVTGQMISSALPPNQLYTGYSNPVPLGQTPRMNSGSMVSQELLIAQQQHQIDSASFNVGTVSLEEQLRRLKQQTSQLEQEQQQIQMAKQNMPGWSYPK
ncbi:UNVERIFIED_CONTAM: hypothetical protein HDU68_000063 [Siphonaria sp. JEL0065]|nr:hypothetical protein HDU68_000063 [Siphonaria sp. JEL0065]